MEFTSKHNQQAGSSAIGIKAEQIAYDYLLLQYGTYSCRTKL